MTIGLITKLAKVADKLLYDAGIRRDLANPALGLDLIGYEPSVGSPLVYGIKGILSQSISLWEKRFSDLCGKPDAANPLTWDWGPAIQAAINYVISLAQASGSTYGLPQIVVPGLRYKVNVAITTVAWVKLNFQGMSIWDFTGSAIGTNHVTITHGPMNVSAGAGAFTGSCMDASGGGLLISGHGLRDSRSAGIYIGNPVIGFSVVREVSLEKISVSNCFMGIQFGQFGTYLCQFTICRIENNFINIVTPKGNVTNSGERMVFDRCIIAGSGDENGWDGSTGAGVLHQCSTFDLFFTNCSFDFNYDVFRLDVGCTYCAITVDTCHVEGWDGYLVNWKSNGANVFVTFNTPTLLPTAYRRTPALVLNSPSQPLVMFNGTQFGRCDVKINNPIIRHTYKPWTEDPFMSVDPLYTEDPAGRRSLTVTGYTPYSFCAIGSRNSVANTDYDFQLDALGTAVSAMKCWEKGGSNLTDNGVLADDGTGKKVLVVTGTDVANYYTLRSKQSYPVKPGSTVYVWSAISTKDLVPQAGSPASPNIQAGVEFQFADGSVRRSTFTVKPMGTVFADAAVPNFSLGNARYIASDAHGVFIPGGVVAVRAYLIYTNFVGKLNISRAGIWVQ